MNAEKELEQIEEMQQMKLHQSIKISTYEIYFLITRVVNGWLYRERSGNGYNTTFVPDGFYLDEIRKSLSEVDDRLASIDETLESK